MALHLSTSSMASERSLEDAEEMGLRGGEEKEMEGAVGFNLDGVDETTLLAVVSTPLAGGEVDLSSSSSELEYLVSFSFSLRVLRERGITRKIHQILSGLC
jgi:hypothetical protein